MSSDQISEEELNLAKEITEAREKLLNADIDLEKFAQNLEKSANDDLSDFDTSKSICADESINTLIDISMRKAIVNSVGLTTLMNITLENLPEGDSVRLFKSKQKLIFFESMAFQLFVADFIYRVEIKGFDALNRNRGCKFMERLEKNIVPILESLFSLDSTERDSVEYVKPDVIKLINERFKRYRFIKKNGKIENEMPNYYIIESDINVDFLVTCASILDIWNLRRGEEEGILRYNYPQTNNKLFDKNFKKIADDLYIEYIGKLSELVYCSQNELWDRFKELK